MKTASFICVNNQRHVKLIVGDRSVFNISKNWKEPTKVNWSAYGDLLHCLESVAKWFFWHRNHLSDELLYSITNYELKKKIQINLKKPILRAIYFPSPKSDALWNIKDNFFIISISLIFVNYFINILWKL